jgi:catechol 2,3-dioxygenase-like lactoylglutathione lyase family enzyme
VRIHTVLALASLVFGASIVHAQAPAAPPPTGAAPTGLVVGSGNFFSPIVADLDKAVSFYRDGLGLDVTGASGDAGNNAALRDMFGLPDAVLRWQIARPPASMSGVEIVEISKAGGKPLERSVQDPGATMLIVLVRDVDAMFAKLKPLGVPVVTRGGGPIAVGTARAVVVKDPAGHFVEIAQLDPLPETKAPATANVIGVRVRLIVDDVDKATRLYRDALGMKLTNTPAFQSNDAVSAMLGLSGGEFRFSLLEVPTTGLVFELMDFKGVSRHTVQGRLQDPGSTRMQLRVRDIGATIAAFEKAGGAVVSTGGKPLDLPAGNNKLKVAIARDPNNLFVVLIESPPPAG